MPPKERAFLLANKTETVNGIVLLLICNEGCGYRQLGGPHQSHGSVG